MIPDWVKILISIAGAIGAAYVTVEVKLATLKTQLEEREKQRLQEMGFVEKRLEAFHQEVIRVRDAYHDIRAKAVEAWGYVRRKQGRELGDDD